MEEKNNDNPNKSGVPDETLDNLLEKIKSELYKEFDVNKDKDSGNKSKS